MSAQTVLYSFEKHGFVPYPPSDYPNKRTVKSSFSPKAPNPLDPWAPMDKHAA